MPDKPMKGWLLARCPWAGGRASITVDRPEILRIAGEKGTREPPSCRADVAHGAGEGSVALSETSWRGRRAVPRSGGTARCLGWRKKPQTANWQSISPMSRALLERNSQ